MANRPPGWVPVLGALSLAALVGLRLSESPTIALVCGCVILAAISGGALRWLQDHRDPGATPTRSMVAENAYDAMFLLLRLWVVTAVAFAVLYGLFVSNQDVQLQLLTAQLLILMMSPAIMAALFQMRRRRNRTDGPGR